MDILHIIRSPVAAGLAPQPESHALPASPASEARKTLYDNLPPDQETSWFDAWVSARMHFAGAWQWLIRLRYLAMPNILWCSIGSD